MSDFAHRVLHRKDERGVIVESKIFGPDDEVSEGFGTQEYVRAADTRLTVPEAVPVVHSRVSEADVSATRTIDETIDQEFVPEAAGELAEDDESGDESEGPTPPPQGGPGSGVEAWREYAGGFDDVEVAESATRDEIVAAVRKAGYPV